MTEKMRAEICCLLSTVLDGRVGEAPLLSFPSSLRGRKEELKQEVGGLQGQWTPLALLGTGKQADQAGARSWILKSVILNATVRSFQLPLCKG